MNNYLSNINSRIYIMSVVGVVVVVFAIVIAYLITPKYKQYHNLSLNLNMLERQVNKDDDVQSAIASLSGEIELAKRQLKGDMANLPEKEMESYIIGVLQNISWDNKINLIGVKPAKGSEIHIFQELLFNVKLSGDYFDLYNWFIEIRKNLGFIVVKKLNISPIRNQESNEQLLMDLTIASYKSIQQ